MTKPNPNQNSIIIQVPINSPTEIEGLLKIDPVIHPTTKKLLVQKEHLLWILHIIYMGSKIERPDKKEAQVKISSARIREYDGHGELYFHWLKKHNFIQASRFVVGRESRSYWLAQPVEICSYEITTPFLIKKIFRLRKKRADQVHNDPLLSKLWQKIQGVNLMPSAWDCIEEISHKVKERGWDESDRVAYVKNEQRKLDIIKSMDLMKGFWFCKGGKGNRIFNPLANLKREVKEEHILVDGEAPGECDIPCSQPQWLLYMLRNGLFTNPSYFPEKFLFTKNGICSYDVKAEIEEFSELFAPWSDFYEFLRTEYNKGRKPEKHKNREDIKEIFMSWIGSVPSKMDRKINLVFEKLFPNFLKLILQYKSKAKLTLTATLQRLEAKLIFEEIFPILFEMDFSFFTCHDSIIYPKSKEAVVRKIWNEKLDQYGIDKK